MSHKNHWFACNWCGYTGKESELEEDGHQCGKDKCPTCEIEGFISCCFESKEEARESFYVDCDELFE